MSATTTGAIPPGACGADEELLFGPEAAERIGISPDTFRSMVRQGLGPAPIPGRPGCRKQWRPADLDAWKARPRGMHGKAQETHLRVAAADAGKVAKSYNRIAVELGISARTVARHLNGECGCNVSPTGATA